MLSSNFFDNDPFFAGHREHMRQMDQMFRSPFGLGGPGMGMMGLEGGEQGGGGHRRGHGQRNNNHQHQQLATQGLFNFGSFGSMFQNMNRMLNDMNSTFENAASNPNGQVFSQSSFMSYSNVDGGQPKVYQASSSSTQGPGGVRETRKMMRDSESGLDKVAVGHHLGERSHVVQRQRNRRTGEQEENKELINLDEEEEPEFTREWMRQAQQVYGYDHGRINFRPERASRRHQALPAPPKHRHQRNSHRERE